ncbi:hypothetical protein ANANG_G00275670, partial [Anguilla anguilla]
IHLGTLLFWRQLLLLGSFCAPSHPLQVTKLCSTSRLTPLSSPPRTLWDQLAWPMHRNSLLPPAALWDGQDACSLISGELSRTSERCTAHLRNMNGDKHKAYGPCF